MTRNTLSKQRTKYSFKVEPVHNILTSMLFIDVAKGIDGLHDFIMRTNARLTPKERRMHRIIINVFWEVISPDNSWENFEDYLDHLGRTNAKEMIDGYWNRLAESYEIVNVDGDKLPDRQALSADPRVFYNYIKNTRQMRELLLTPDTCMEAIQWLEDPVFFKNSIIDHLQFMWERHLQDEWQRVEPLVATSVEDYNNFDLSDQGPVEAVQKVFGREIHGAHWVDYLDTVIEVIFVPSMHIKPYATHFRGDGKVWLSYGADIADERDAAYAVGRSQLLVTLAALADETRFAILEKVAEDGEVTAQEIIHSFDLTQPTASRHLVRLCATGLLVERRRHRVKVYRIDPNAVEIAMDAITDRLQDTEPN
jgi:DNA-binding transcriptional ArsR family regulator